MIRDRIEDALILWKSNRIEGAFVSILIAVAATAKKRYSRKKFKDNEIYKKFLLDEMGSITGGPSQNVKFYHNGKYKVPLENIIYNILRCELIHEGATPQTIHFEEPILDNRKIYNTLKLYDPIGFPIGWIWNLARIVINAPENADEFRNVKIQIPIEYPNNAGIMVSYPEDDPKRTGID